MEYFWSLFLFPLFVILVVCFVIGVIVFIVDVFRFSRRPEKFEDISKTIGTDEEEEHEKNNINIDDIF